MIKSKSTQLNCFSPPVMLATLTIETVLAVYTVWRYKLDSLGRLVVISLLSLGLFQLCEYHVCGGMGLEAKQWSRLGYVAITLLPALGLHILHVLANKSSRKFVAVCYASMVAFVGYFLLASHAFTGYQCTGNYVIFQIGARATWLYSLYYYGWLVAAIAFGVRWANQLQKNARATFDRVLAIRGLIIGYLVFLVPTTIANSVKPETRSGIPSIMCGFAVLFAIILVAYILPRLGHVRQHQAPDILEKSS